MGTKDIKLAQQKSEWSYSVLNSEISRCNKAVNLYFAFNAGPLFSVYSKIKKFAFLLSY